jgi:hypothetical protein
MGTHDDIWADAGGFWNAAYGEAVTVITPAGAERACMGLVTRAGSQMADHPRGQVQSTTVSLPNSTTTGIGFAEWNNRFVVRLALAGQASVTLRTLRVLHGSAAADRLTFELG